MGIVLGDAEKFICPDCGGSYFSSSELRDGSLMRRCSGCGYHWHESRDIDHLYTKVSIIRKSNDKKKTQTKTQAPS